MPTNSNEEEDRKLFEFYLKHGYYPDDFNTSKKLNVIEENIIDDKKNNDYKNSKEELVYTEEDKEMFLSAIENLDCTNHSKKSIYDKKTNYKFKPNIKNAVPKDRLDLHGCTREIALHKIRKFIAESKKNKLTPILIIHGKGFRSENGIAVLKDLVEYYIATEGKHYIKYSSDAPSHLGGGGAKIIYLHIESNN